MKREEFVEKVYSYIHNENLINNPFRTMFDYIVEGRELNGSSLLRSMDKNIFANDVTEMLEDSHIQERLKSEIIPKMEAYIKKNVRNVVNERSFIDKVMSMLFGPKDFGISHGIVNDGVFSEEIDDVIGAKHYNDFNAIIESLNSLRLFNDNQIRMLKPIQQPMKFTESMEYIESVMEMVNTNDIIENGKYDYGRIKKFVESYAFIMEMDGVNIVTNWFKKPYEYVKKVTKNLYTKIKSYTNDTYELNVDINKLYAKNGNMTIMGRDGMNMMLDMPVDLFNEVAEVTKEILEKTNVIYNNHGTSIDFDATIQKIKKASNTLDSHMKSKFITKMGDNEETFNHAVFTTYNKKSQAVIKTTAAVYRRVMDIEKLLTEVKYSGDESKENLYNDLKKVIDILKGVISLMESNFSYMFSKYREVLTKVLDIAKNIKSDGSLDKVDTDLKNHEDADVNDDDVADKTDDDDDDYDEALNDARYKYHFYEFVNSDTNNQISQYLSDSHHDLIVNDLAESFNEPLNEEQLPIIDLNFVTYKVNEMKAGLNQFLSVFKETKDDVAYLTPEGVLVDEAFIEELQDDINRTDTSSLEEMNKIFETLNSVGSLRAVPATDFVKRDEEVKPKAKSANTDVFVTAVNRVVDGENSAFIEFNDILKRTTIRVKENQNELERIYSSEYNIEGIVDVLHNILKKTTVNEDGTLSFVMLPTEDYNDIMAAGGAEEIVFNYTAGEMREISSFMFKILTDKVYLNNIRLIKKTPGNNGTKVVTLIAVVMKEINRII